MSDEHWLIDHLLGEQSDAEAAEAQRRLDADSQLQARAAGLADVVRRLDDMSPAAWELGAAVDAAAAAADAGRRALPADRPRRAPAWAPSPALAALVAVALVAIGVGLGAWLFGAGGGSGPGRAVALRPLPGTPADAAGQARISSSGRVSLAVSRLPQAGRGRYYEAWLMTSRTRLVPIASFEVDHRGSARLTVPLPAPASGYRYVDVSLQRLGAGIAHSHRSVLRGPTGG